MHLSSEIKSGKGCPCIWWGPPMFPCCTGNSPLWDWLLPLSNKKTSQGHCHSLYLAQTFWCSQNLSLEQILQFLPHPEYAAQCKVGSTVNGSFFIAFSGLWKGPKGGIDFVFCSTAPVTETDIFFPWEHSGCCTEGCFVAEVTGYKLLLKQILPFIRLFLCSEYPVVPINAFRLLINEEVWEDLWWKALWALRWLFWTPWILWGISVKKAFILVRRWF